MNFISSVLLKTEILSLQLRVLGQTADCCCAFTFRQITTVYVPLVSF